MAKPNCCECAKHNEAKLQKLAKKLKKVISHVRDCHGDELSVAGVRVVDGCIVIYTGDYL